MSQPSKVDMRLAATLCGLIGLYDILYVSTTIAGSAVLGYRIEILFLDFLVFHAATRAFFAGRLDLIYDPVALTELQNRLYAAHLPLELDYRPFLYPPLWLLDLLPFGLLPVGLSVAAFLMVTAGLCFVALRALGLGIVAVVAILVSPAAAWVVFAGQNTFLSVALLYGGLALLERRPLVAGVLLGLLAYKPQLWLLVPVALLAARAWRPLFAMAGTVALSTLATLLLFGTDPWLAFLDTARRAGAGADATILYERVGAHMTTLLAAGKRLGLGDGPAVALQLAGSALALVGVVWAFARHGPSHERTAMLAAATFLVSPYTLDYDLLLLMPAVALLFLHPSPRGSLPGERLIFLALWFLPAFCNLLNTAGLPLAPAIVLLFGSIAWIRLQSTTKVELPSPATAG